MKRGIVVLALVAATGLLAAHAADSTQMNGWISDSMCGAKHAGTGAACVRKCIEGGLAPVFVDQKMKAVWTIENPDAVKGFYGDHVTVKASEDAAKKSLHVVSIAEAK